MRLGISFTQYNEINNELPDNYKLGYELAGEHFIETVSSYRISEVLTPIIQNLYNQSMEDFLNSLERKPDRGLLRESGAVISERFIQRNSADNINSSQSAWVLHKAGAITMFLVVGALVDAKNMLLALTPDDMSEPYHWITQERIDMVLADIEEAYANI
jgi:hypothetical protein